MTATTRPRTIRDTATQLRNGDLSVVELLNELLARIEATDRDVQAWLDVRPRFLLETAATMDRRLAVPRTPPPLLGIPLGIKDIVDVAGYQTVCNMASRETIDVAARDADVVGNWRRDGALLVGKTVTQPAAAGVISDPCRNPWDTDRIPGGSSGGSAAAVANGTALGGLGTDTGGSIRIPAALCGVAGLKPTYGRLSGKGIFPLSASLDTPGPIARTVADCVALYLSMAKRADEIPAVWDRYAEGGTSLTGKRIGVLRSFFTDQVQDAVRAAFDEAVVALEQLGAEIVPCDWPEAAGARTVAMYTSRIESAQVHRDLIRNNPELMNDALRDRVEVGALLPADAWFRLRSARLAVRDSIASVYREHRLDAIVAPTTPATAPLASETHVTYEDGSREEIGAAMTRLAGPWNATGQPVVAVPCGFDGQGLPIGLSFIGRPDEELALADIAHAYEQAHDFWMRMPPSVS